MKLKIKDAQGNQSYIEREALAALPPEKRVGLEVWLNGWVSVEKFTNDGSDLKIS